MKKNLIAILYLTGVTSRTVQTDQYDALGYSSENSLAAALLTKPDMLSPVVTYYMGKDSQKLPLTFMAESNENVEKVEDVQYEWRVIGRKKHTDQVVSSPHGAAAGVNGTPITVIFKSEWFKYAETIMSPNGTRCRVMTKPERVGTGFRYTLQLKNPDATATLDTTEFVAGRTWVQSGLPTVSGQLSTGTESNRQTPGKRTNQISFVRRSYHITGNIANRKVAELRFNISDDNGGKSETMMWMDWEEWNNNIDFKQDCEEHYWTSEYNRKVDGSIVMKDFHNGEPIPEGAGILQIVREANFDTYGLNLTVSKLSRTVGDVMYGATDTKNMEVVIYCGMGFAQDFDAAIKADGNGRGFAYAQSEKEITGAGGSWSLQYGAYFNSYRTVTGHTIVLKQMDLFDFGSMAELDRANGRLHPRTGYPMSSHQGIFVDQSMYDGERNVKMYAQKGREYIRGIEKGMTPLPDSWGGNANDIVSTGLDKASLHIFASKGANIKNERHCFLLQCDIN